MSLERFLTAQASPHSGFKTAYAELQSGRKTSHWIWYVLPQLEVLGRSDTAKFYGLKDAAEAIAYLQNSTLRGNLRTMLEVIAAQFAQGVSVRTLMGSETDSLKLASCLTLFEQVATSLHQTADASDGTAIAQRCSEILGRMEPQGFSRCRVTLRELDTASGRKSR
jgi:uncharacterized protein (DUF1810 family)